MLSILIKLIGYDILCAILIEKRFESVKLSTTARYGLRAMSYLSVNVKDSPIPINDIASGQNIPVTFLEQILMKLRRGGLLESVRGAHGGYKLAKNSSEITISEILCALNEPVIWGECQTEKGCENVLTCPTFNLWKRVKSAVDNILTSTTLEEISSEKICKDSERKAIRDKALRRNNL